MRPTTTPSDLNLLPADDTGTLGDGITSDRRPHLVGKATPSGTVQVVDRAGNLVGSTIAGPDGSFSAQPTAPLADGNYTLSARNVDAAGGVGPSGPTFTLTIDGQAPPTPSAPALLPADDTGTPGDGITSVRSPHLRGTAVPGATVQVLDANGAIVASTIAGADGTFSVQPTAPLADGRVSLSAIASDAAGNASPIGPATLLTIDGTAPLATSALLLLPADDSGALGDGITAVSKPRLSGTAEPGSTVQVVDGSGAVVASTTAAPDGTFAAQPSMPLADGSHRLAALAIDAAGNAGPLGQALALTILANGPGPPAAPALALSDDTGVKGDGLTSVRRPRLLGKVGPGLAVDLLDATGAAVASTTAGADGSYALQVPNALPVGVKSWSVRRVTPPGTPRRRARPWP